VALGPLPFEVQFTNPAGAAGAVQTAVITSQLDADLAPSTLQFTSFGFGTHRFDVPAGRTSFAATADLRSEGIDLLVQVNLAVNATTGVVSALFRSLDPSTGLPPADGRPGFLRLGDSGLVSYTVSPRPELPSGTVIDNRAAIFFDVAPNLETALARLTMDTEPPHSLVAELPALSAPDFTLNWSGADDTGGAGLASFDVFVAIDGGAFTPLHQATTETSASFSGARGHSYSFYSVATDHTGAREPIPAAAQASTTVPARVATSIALTSSHAAGSFYGEEVTITVALTSADATAGIPTGTVNFSVDGVAFGNAVALTGGSGVVTLTVTGGRHEIAATFTSNANLFLDSATAAPLTQEVRPAPLLITALSQSKVYGAAMPAPEVQYAGFVNGDSAGSLDAAPMVTTTATAGSNVGSYPISVAGALDGSYAITFAGGTFTVTPAPLIISADDQTIAAGAALPPLTMRFTGLVNGDSEATLDFRPSATTTAVSGSPSGVYLIDVSAASRNYTITVVRGTLRILPAPALALALAPPRTVKATGRVASFRRVSLAGPATGVVTVRVSTTLGKLRLLRFRGLKTAGANTSRLTLTGNRAVVERGLKTMSLLFAKPRSRARVTLTALAGRQSKTMKILVA
jgi:hypothetical protein